MNSNNNAARLARNKNKNTNTLMKTLPTSGSEPSTSNRLSYQRPKKKRRNNCMAYAFDENWQNNYYKQQPGNKSKQFSTNLNLSSCKDLKKRIIVDYPGTYELKNKNRNSACKKGYAKVFAFIAPDRDFHFYRQDSNGYVSHKRGLSNVEIKDACGKRIVDPLKSCRDFGDGLNYKRACGVYCRQVKAKK